MHRRYNRRTFIHQLALGSSMVLLSRCAATGALLPFSRGAISDGPINRDLPDIAPRSFFGPDPVSAHAVLWNPAGQTAPTRWITHEGPVIIGGGMSGLVSAFSLRASNPLVLESSHRFGGNSQGQEWRNITYSIGAAYIVVPEADSPIESLLNQLDLKSQMKISRSEDLYALDGSIRHGLWHGGKALYGAAHAQVDRVRDHILRIAEDHPDARYPDMPTDDQELRSWINQLDRTSFSAYLEQIAGGPLPEPLATTLEQYCWSSFGGSASEISAASGLNFYGSEFSDIGVFAGGNAAIAETLQERLIEHNGRDSLRSNSLVSRLETTASGIRLVVHPTGAEPYGIEAPCTIVACPKFVAKRIIQNLPADQLGAMNRLRYRSYLTANLLLKEPLKRSFYDLYLLKQQNGHAFGARTPIETLGGTDAIVADWYYGKTGRESVLSLYRALPYDGARAEFYDPSSYERVRRAFERQIQEELLPLLGVSLDHLTDMRITRWGHALPLAESGLIAQGLPDLLSRPIGDRIFFANQDNWALPAFETAVTVGLEAAEQVRRILG